VAGWPALHRPEIGSDHKLDAERITVAPILMLKAALNGAWLSI
jgi:hypothetical protein